MSAIVDASTKPVSVFVAMPCYSEIQPAFVTSLMKLQATLLRLGVTHRVEFLPGESLITRARNRMCWAFLEQPAFSHLLFLDVDLSFQPSAVLRLLGSGHDVCAAPYAKKGEGQGSVGVVEIVGHHADAANGKHAIGKVDLDGDGWVKARDVGTGCLLISRKALVTMASKMTPYTCDMTEGGPRMFPFFDCGVENGSDPGSRYLSEDYWFCRLWQSLGGGDVWLDTRAVIGHVGRKQYNAPSIGAQWELSAEGKYGVVPSLPGEAMRAQLAQQAELAQVVPRKRVRRAAP